MSYIPSGPTHRVVTRARPPRCEARANGHTLLRHERRGCLGAASPRNGGLVTRPEVYDCGVFPEHLGDAAEQRAGSSPVRPGRVRGRRGMVGAGRRGTTPSPHPCGDAEDDLGTTSPATTRPPMSNGFRSCIPPQPFVHITRQGVTNAWTKYGVKHHLARFRTEQVVVAQRPRGSRPATYCGRHRPRARAALRRDRLRRRACASGLPSVGAAPRRLR